ncbi:TlpA family protein disulfide reductase [Chryseobacterium oncorhynchi]|nr:redoxin domain-containing protein [Chryseobacterium oncorhynchi]
MKKKNLKFLAIIIPLLSIGVMAYLLFIFQKKKEKLETLKNVPTFSLKTIDGIIFTQQNLATDRIKVILYFSPTCHYCQSEAKELSNVYHQYENIQWIWIASEPLHDIKQFAHHYQLDNKYNIFWCHDDMAKLYQKLSMKSVPYFLVYDKNNHLIKRNSGAVKLEKLINTIDERE